MCIFATNLGAEAYHVIKWAPIESAFGYTIEIKDANGKTIFENAKEPSVRIKLSKGKYLYRVAVLNKFKKIEKWSGWNELEIRPVALPIVTSATSEVQSEGNVDKITFNGENIYEGTKAFVIQDGKKIPAEIQTSRDGKVSVVSINQEQVDRKKNYKVTLENPNFDPIEVPIVGKQTATWEDPRAETHVSETAKPVDDLKKNIWPMFWRQALLPGWGHYYIGEKKTAYAYMSIFGLFAFNTLREYREYRLDYIDFKSNQENWQAIRALDPSGNQIPFFTTSIIEEIALSKLEERENKVRQSINLMGIVYLGSLLHILYTGYSHQSKDLNQSNNFQMGFRYEEPNLHIRSQDKNQMRVDLRYTFFY
ncbi:hypothetical protein LPTSP4_14820 [Leptospira ryugenii]|uniref:DUF5683 domain-containing protein n=1 Tax=Leptospira ryugenii TaxID=1917863 RepID=A0A2P2DZA6_9LEPT|nr:hypothetical protein LPTSP4_14820 [Leptospira ryugenii]